LKLIKKLSGLAIGLLLICGSKWLSYNTTEHVKKLEKSKPFQVTIEKNGSHIIKDFYPEFGVEHDLFLEQFSVKSGMVISKTSPPSIKITIERNGVNINAYEYNTSHCNDTKYTTCKIASFKGIEGQKHTIHINIKSIASELYYLNPQIEARVSRMHITKGYILSHQLQEVFMAVMGFAISIVSILILAIEFITKKYKKNKYP
jgi:hypothetical protein